MDNLQWFKFSPKNWIMGKIQRCPDVTQARFIRLICIYWNKECIMSCEDAEIEIDKEHLEILISKKIITVDNDFIRIEFLDDQIEKIEKKAEINAKNGKLGGRPVSINSNAGNTNLYVVRLYNDVESFIKVGITSSSIARRMGNIPYKYEVLYHNEFNLSEALNIEKIFSDCAKYAPLKSFGGKLECFSNETEVLNCLNNYLHNPKKTETIPRLLQNDTEKSKSTELDNIILPNLSVDWESLKESFNKLTGKKTKIVSEKVKRQIKARLKEGYSKQDLWNAIVNCFNDPYHKENPKYLTLEFISRSDKMEKYCENLKTKKPKEDKL